MKDVSDPEISGIIQALSRYAKDKPKTSFILFGGSALYVHGLREVLTDIDAYTNSKKTMFDWRNHGDHDVDLTSDLNLFGDLDIADVAEDAKHNLLYEDERMSVHVLSIETLYIQKSNSAREKDIVDLMNMRDATTPAKVIQRMADLKKYNIYGKWYFIAENLLAELQLQYNQPVTTEMIKSLGMITRDEEILCSTFGHINQKKNCKHQKISL